MSFISINTYLDGIASNLIIKGSEKEAIEKSLTTFRTRMISYFSTHEYVDLNEIKVFGSYERDTNLPRRVDYNTDVDIMLVFDNDGATPQTYLDRVRRAVEYWYSSSEIKQSSPTIVLDMVHIKFEITPAIYQYGQYRIKTSGNDWMTTYCNSDFNNLAVANRINHYMIKPTLRLVKYWNKTKNYGVFSSYDIEQAIVNHYLVEAYQGYDTKEYLLTGLKAVRRLAYADTIKECIDKAIYNCSEAIKDEEKYPSIAMDEIKRVIGEL